MLRNERVDRAAAGAHEPHAAAPRAGRGRDFSASASRPGDAASADHRPRRRLPADCQRGRNRLDRLQRRNLQLSASCVAISSAAGIASARTATPKSSSMLTKSSARRCVEFLDGMFAFAIYDGRTADTSVRPSALSRSRSVRKEAAVLRRLRRHADFRIRDQADPAGSPRLEGDRLRRVAPLSVAAWSSLLR